MILYAHIMHYTRFEYYIILYALYIRKRRRNAKRTEWIWRRRRDGGGIDIVVLLLLYDVFFIL